VKHLILLIFIFFLFGCSNIKKVYWCGDHACINNKEKESYFKKTMIIEIKELTKQKEDGKSELEKIKKQAGLKLKKEIQDEKELAKQTRLEEKRRIKDEKKLAKQISLEEKRRIKDEKKLAKQISLEEKKLSKKKVLKTKNVPLEKKVVINTDIAKIDISSSEYEKLMEKIIKKNMFRSYPDINNIPNK